MRWKKKKNHHSSRIIQFVYILFLYWFSKILRSVLRPMVKYGPANSRLPCAYLRDWDSPQATTLMARRLGPSGLRSKMASSSSTSTSSTSSPFSTSSPVPRASISRERVPKSNTGTYKERGNSDPNNRSPCDRIEEFPGENLCLRGGKLFCNGCKEILSSKKSILKNHLASKKHVAGKEK